MQRDVTTDSILSTFRQLVSEFGWSIRPEERQAIVRRQLMIAVDPESKSSDASRAASTLLGFDRQNRIWLEHLVDLQKSTDRRAIETSKERTRRDAISLHERRFAWRRSHDRARFRMDRARRPRLPGEEHLIGQDWSDYLRDWEHEVQAAESEFGEDNKSRIDVAGNN